MNCLPALVPTLAAPGALASMAAVGDGGAFTTVASVVGVAGVVAGDAAAVVVWPRRRRAALSLGWALPKPQPPSRVWAMMAPAHLPVLKSQQPEAQSASLSQGPVMNCVPVP